MPKLPTPEARAASKKRDSHNRERGGRAEREERAKVEVVVGGPQQQIVVPAEARLPGVQELREGEQRIL